jgi:glyoxylase-like metal-dependent hydrolase (beta-lactamase superfamily II)
MELLSQRTYPRGDGAAVLEQYTQVVQTGDARGNGMILKFRFPSGLVIHALPTPNEYGGEWDLGPTWNYLVEADRLFLVDCGRWGTGGYLVETVAQLGLRPKDLDFVLLSHGHEDHDGGLGEIVARTGAKVKAHGAYGRLVRKYPDLAPAEYKRDFPAKCWHCFMPESFYTRNCLAYHAELEEIPIQAIGDGRCRLATDMETLHIPGHSPDSMALMIGEEALLVGDVILPGITPWPTSLGMHRVTAGVLGAEYPDPATLYGLKRYIKSIKEMKAFATGDAGPAVLPAHRLFHQGRLHSLDLAGRVDELISHHIDRCADILRILAQGPQDAEAIASQHFEADKLRGPGMMMAKNEVICHCELLTEAGDVARTAERKYQATGSDNFIEFIGNI